MPPSQAKAKSSPDLMEHRLATLERSFERIDATLKTGLDNIATRMERVVAVETKQASIEQDITIAHEKLRLFDIESRNLHQVMASVQSSLTILATEVPRLSGVMNGESGLIPQSVLMKTSLRWHTAAIVGFGAILGSAVLGAVAVVANNLISKVLP